MADTLTITDDRTGRSYQVPIEEGAIRATALRQIKVDDDDFGLMSYDPAFLNTASTRSAITLVDGDRGILRYRGYPIEQLAEESTYLEAAYLLLFGELPTEAALRSGSTTITHHTFLHENMKRLMEGFRYDAHPMGMFVSAVAALSTFYPEASEVHDPEVRLAADPPADRQGADGRGVLVPPQPRPAVRLPRERPRLRLELPLDDVPHGGAEVHRRPRAGAGARGAVHPPCRPRAELLGERDPLDRLEPRRSVQRARGCRRRALRAAARRGERGGAAHARRDRRRPGACLRSSSGSRRASGG